MVGSMGNVLLLTIASHRKDNMKFSVTVTADDIKKGKKESSEYCPLARALRRTLKAADITVDPHEGGVVVDGLGLEYNGAVAAFTDRFDEGKTVKPRTFVFELHR
jgi:hypothetical protein